MLVLVIYDITEDDVRKRVADLLLQYGFKRIQYSAFIGRLPSYLLKDLVLKLRKITSRAHGNIQIIRITWRQYASRIEIGTRRTRFEQDSIHII